ncbi:signal peptide peptidase-domain-containing protein [Desarmillaria tabescens]|uniref:Signal peptide peptidase-domain-containing protein n=1 Tax=Armillaria tabescens TaxID=1929756 RepID=A0AA39N8T3_ARMTA|nr:signal peptide peptidase-domain-containing protein [Desarmillaria tabescens]KAK0461132.1 signal peptide peptidase-domain-containing protein [Desarmillaria tabescens]
MTRMKDIDWDLLSSYAGLLTLASTSIYLGSLGSLPNTKGNGADESDEDEDVERVSSEDAWLFPLIGSVTLFALYMIIQYFGKEWINWLLGMYFSVAGMGSVWKSSISLYVFAVGRDRWKKYGKHTFTIYKDTNKILTLSWRTPTLYLLPLSIIPSALYTFSATSRKSVLLTDILSLSFSHNALSLLKIDSFKTGSILLTGLFFYDIWWVFGTRVMVEVATTLDIPIKLLWPKSMVFSDLRGFTMLGLGDVVIPGAFIALALRYDYHRFSRQSHSGTRFSRPYFHASLSAYVTGLVTTMSVMHFFGKAQPALLYLSPACILSFVMTALCRGELSDAWDWSDTPPPASQDQDAGDHMEEKAVEGGSSESKD